MGNHSPAKVIGITGARPNFMKIEPIFRALDTEPDRFSTWLIHTGQHYDDRMSKIFFRDLGLRQPDIDLGVGSSTHAQQTAAIMVELERIMVELEPDLVLVVGDVNSTMAAAVTAAKLHIPIAHVEAGLRSFDRSMPEEVNRVVTDALSTYLFTPSRDADRNLIREGIPENHIFFVGNVMIDTLQRFLRISEKSPIFTDLGVEESQFALVTLHRPSNVDDSQVLDNILRAFAEIQETLPIVFPVHPRTEKQIRFFGFQSITDKLPNLQLIPPLGYIDFLALEAKAKFVLTDSGGIQEETTALGIPCLTMRHNTERPVTVTHGTNQILGTDKDKIVAAANKILNGHPVNGQVPERWDGCAAERIVAILLNCLD
jgi:UDP-N-acetylglucosamine 2-epimerase (non-hydrolysing)